LYFFFIEGVFAGFIAGRVGVIWSNPNRLHFVGGKFNNFINSPSLADRMIAFEGPKGGRFLSE